MQSYNTGGRGSTCSAGCFFPNRRDRRVKLGPRTAVPGSKFLAAEVPCTDGVPYRGANSGKARSVATTGNLGPNSNRVAPTKRDSLSTRFRSCNIRAKFAPPKPPRHNIMICKILHSSIATPHTWRSRNMGTRCPQCGEQNGAIYPFRSDPLTRLISPRIKNPQLDRSFTPSPNYLFFGIISRTNRVTGS